MMFPWPAQTGKHLLRTQNVSEQRQTFFVSRTQILCPQQMLRAGKRGNICVGNNVSSFARALNVTFRSMILPKSAFHVKVIL